MSSAPEASCFLVLCGFQVPRSALANGHLLTTLPNLYLGRSFICAHRVCPCYRVVPTSMLLMTCVLGATWITSQARM